MILFERSKGLARPVLGKGIGLLGAIVLVGGLSAPGGAQSIAPANDGTGTIVNAAGNRFDIQGGTLSGDGRNLFQSFERFGLSQDQIANFLTNPNIQNIVGRVVGGNPSVINGRLQVTGGASNLFLVNPAGILFGTQSSLNLPGSLTVTTANQLQFGNGLFNTIGTNDYANLIGSPTAFAFTGTQPGSIANFGNLAVTSGQNLTLLGGTVLNQGQLSAPGGQITIAAVPGQTLVRVSQAGNPLSLEFRPISPASTNLATLPSLPELLTGGSVPTATGVTVNPDGTLQLTGSTLKIPTQPGTAIVSGQVTTASDTASAMPSAVTIVGDRIGVINSQIDASGVTQGGTVRIGGAYQGQASLPQASQVFVDPNSVIRANGTQGQGGQVVLWSTQGTQFTGQIAATGKTQGGSVEVSSKQNLLATGQIDTSGGIQAGSILLDPLDLTIEDSATTPYDTPFNPFSVQPNQILFSQDPTANYTLTTNTLTGLTGNITLQANRDLILRTNLTFMGASRVGSTLEFDATRNFNGSAYSVNTNGMNLTINARNVIVGNVNTVGSTGSGNVNFTATGANLETGSITTSNSGGNGGNVTLSGYNSLSVLGSINTAGSQTGGTVQATTSGNLVVNSAITTRGLQGGGVTLSSPSGSLQVGSINASGTTSGGQINLLAGQNLTTSIVNSTGGNVSVDSPTAINLSSGLNLQGANLTIGNQLSPTQVLLPASVSTQGGSFSLKAQGDFAFPNTFVNSGGGAISVQTSGILSVPSSIAFSSNTGNISLQGTSILAPQLFLDSSNASSGKGGNVSVVAQNQIQLEAIDTHSAQANGGNVLIDPQGDVEIGYINAQGGTSGIGGTVDITTDRFLRLTSSFSDNNGVLASISTAGGAGGGSITLRTSSSSPSTPFIVGDASTNGSQQTLTTGLDNQLSPTRSIQGDFQQGTSPAIIHIITPGTQSSSPGPSPSSQTTFADYTSSRSRTDALQQKQPPPPPPPRPENRSSNAVQINSTRSDFETKSTLEVSEHLNLPGVPKVLRVPEAQTLLKTVAQTTGVKPALLYVDFVPQTDSEVTQTPQGPQITTQNRDQLELLLVTGNHSPVVIRVPHTDRDQVLAVAREFRSQVADPSKTRTRSYLKSAEQLYQWLITPIEPTLKAQGIGNIALILDTGMRFIPLAALYDGHQFLIEKYSLGLMPSLSLTDTRIVNLSKAELLAGGATQFADQNPLPAVPLELETIRRNWPGVSLINNQFTLANLKGQRQEQPFGLIHLATHGEFLPGNLRNSYIQLSDTRLRLDQLREMNWNHPSVDLLVLSACRMALGDENAELGFAGLAIQAGVKSALASLWSVSDEGTSGLMAEFYDQLRRSPIKAEALRQAQIAMLKGEVRLQDGNLIWSGGQTPLPPALQELGNRSLSHPYYWAAFTLIGSPW